MEVAAAAQQKKKLQLELEQIEKEKIRMLAEIEAVEEQQQQDEERMGIEDIGDLAKSHADSEIDTQYSKEGMARDNDIVMADSGEDEEVDDAFVEVDTEPELEGPDAMKMVSKLTHREDNRSFADLGVLFNRRGRLLGLGEIFEQRLTRRRKGLVRNQGCSFFLLFYLLTTYINRWINNQPGYQIRWKRAREAPQARCADLENDKVHPHWPGRWLATQDLKNFACHPISPASSG